MGLCKWAGVTHNFDNADYLETVHTDEFNSAIFQIAVGEHSRIADHTYLRLTLMMGALTVFCVTPVLAAPSPVRW
jgi:hypothetical protein